MNIRHRHTRRHNDRHSSRDHEELTLRERHQHHRQHRDEHKERAKSIKEDASPVDQVALFQTFAKLCAQMQEKSVVSANVNQVPRSQSHKSLQCEVVSRRESFQADQRPVRLHSGENSRDNISPSRTLSHNHVQNRIRSHENIAALRDNRIDKCECCDPYEKRQRYSSKTNVRQKQHDERYSDYPVICSQTRSYINRNYSTRVADQRDLEDERKKYEARQRTCEQKASRSFDVPRDDYIDEERSYRRTARSDGANKRYEERNYRDRCEQRNRDKYHDYDNRERNIPTLPSKDGKSRRHLDRFEKLSIASKDDDYRDRDKYSEREQYSGLSAADGETSTVSGKSNYLKVVKQEISEQREAMDKMMKLWKELMRCFKGVSQTQGAEKSNVIGQE